MYITRSVRLANENSLHRHRVLANLCKIDSIDQLTSRRDWLGYGSHNQDYDHHSSTYSKHRPHRLCHVFLPPKKVQVKVQVTKLSYIYIRFEMAGNLFFLEIYSKIVDRRAANDIF